MSRIITYSSAVTFTPTGTTGSSNISTSTSYPLSNGYNGTSNTSSYARLQLSANNTSTTCYIYYTFNVNGIPSNATINSVSCTARIYRNSRVTQNTSAIQLYNGTTAKGSATTGLTTTASNIQIASTGSWTVSELSNIRLRISGARSSTNNSSYIYFYGADLTVNYTVNGVEYEVTATSEYNGASVSPLSQFVSQGENAVVKVYTDTLDNMVLEDNGNDVIESLQYITVQQSNTATSVPTSTFTTGGTDGARLYMSSTSTGSDWLEQAIGHSAENPNTTNTGHTYCKGTNNSQNASGWIIYNFDFSEIPENAIIDSTEVKVYGSRESSTNSTTYRARVELYSGNSVKGSYYDLTNTNYSIVTIPAENTGTWTRAELQQAKLRFSVAYYGGRVNGITWNVNYHINEPPHYEYTISNIAADHDIVFKEAIIVPPEEDPQKQYFSLTISSINATTEPGRGTIRVESGTSETIKIYPSDPQLTLTTDNGTNISGQLVYHAGGQPTYEVSTVPDASYGFALNNGTGYYVSQNTGVDESAAVSRIDFDLPVSCLVTFQFINYAEATYDFGVFGNIDVALSNDYYPAGSGGATISDSNYRLACNTSTYNTSSVQTLTYEIPAGQHYIYVKYSKDDGSSSNNDSLQWKISNIEPLSSVSDAYYEYTLSNINQNHSLIFIFGNVTYYFVTSTHDGNGKLYPDGQTVCLPGDTYRLTIVPETAEDTVTISDNNTDVTNSLERKEIITEKNGQSALTVNYVYTISNVQTAHTISVHDSSVVRYPINASSTYTGATVSPSYQSIEEGTNATINIQVNNAYEIKVKDNGTDVTSSLVAGDGRCTYTINNVQSAHTIVVEEAPYYTVTGSSTYTGATVSAPGKVYAGQTATVTVSVGNKYEIVFKDNNVDKTSSLAGSTGTLTYTLTNVQANHTIAVSEATYYTITTANTYTGASISCPSKVYAGQSVTATITVANLYEIVFKDNNVEKTPTGSNGTFTYTLNNVTANHTFSIAEATNYTITTSSSYNGVTATANPTKVYAGRSCTVTIAGASKDTMVVKDNNTDVTSSLVGNSSPYTYTLSNVTTSHTITVTPITYAVNASSTFAGVTVSPTSSTVIKGNSVTLTINAPNTYSIRVTDNGTVVTGSLTGSANNYKYTISNVTAAHTVVVSEATYYTVSGSSSYNGATLSVPGKVYAGQTATVTVSVPNKYQIVFKDNNTDKTSSLAGTSNTFTYTLTNVQADHTISVTEARYYAVSTSSSYAGATASANPTKVYTGQSTKSSEITVSVANLYEVVIKDNGTDITNSFTGSNGTYKYTITNISANHSVVITEATYYTITTSSTYAPAHISANPTKVYAGRSTTITITGASKNDIIVKDNGVNVTSSLVGSNTTYTYTISNVLASHTVTVEEKPAVTYQVNASSTYSRATITPTASTVVEGDTLVLTITGDTVPIKVTDNNVDVTSSLVTNGATKTYTLTNIVAAHTIVVSFVQTALVRTSSGYVAGKKFYKKTGASTWTEMTLSELQTYMNSNSIFYD